MISSIFALPTSSISIRRENRNIFIEWNRKNVQNITGRNNKRNQNKSKEASEITAPITASTGTTAEILIEEKFT